MSNASEPAGSSDNDEYVNDDGSTSVLGPDMIALLSLASNDSVDLPLRTFSEDSLDDPTFNHLSPLHDPGPHPFTSDFSYLEPSSNDPNMSTTTQDNMMATAATRQSPKRGRDETITTPTAGPKKQRTTRSGSQSVIPTVKSVGAVPKASSSSKLLKAAAVLQTRVLKNSDTKKKGGNTSNSNTGRGQYLCGDCGKEKKGHICEVGKSRTKPPRGINVTTQTATQYCPEGQTWSAAQLPLAAGHLNVRKYSHSSQDHISPTRNENEQESLDTLKESIALVLWLAHKWKSNAAASTDEKPPIAAAEEVNDLNKIEEEKLQTARPQEEQTSNEGKQDRKDKGDDDEETSVEMVEV